MILAGIVQATEAAFWKGPLIASSMWTLLAQSSPLIPNTLLPTSPPVP